MILPCSPILFERRIFIVDLETKFLQALVVINMSQFFVKCQYLASVDVAIHLAAFQSFPTMVPAEVKGLFQM